MHGQLNEFAMYVYRALFFYLCTAIVLFCDFLKFYAGYASMQAAFYEISTLSILTIVKYSEFTSMDLVLSPKCTFLRSECEKTNVNIEKTLASATCFDSNAPYIFSYSLKIYLRININTIQRTTCLINIKFKIYTLNGTLWTIPGLNSVKIVLIYKCCNEQIVFRQRSVVLCQIEFFQACPCCKTIRKINNFT
jgi:hypothetical protein